MAKKLSTTTSRLFREKGYISMIDLFVALRFSKSGQHHIEQAYATHFLKPNQKPKPEPKQRPTSVDAI